ncbi:MAG: pyridoxal-phosphate dependent enzyme, partial [Arenimonas sp.]
LGAKVVLTPAALRGRGMLTKAEELAREHDWFLCRQFDNPANADMHSRTTAPEILEAFKDERLDYFVTGSGTGGTLKGVARVLKVQRPELKVIVCEPDNAPVLASGIAQKRDEKGSPSESHPLSRPHVMQGWSPDFVPQLTEDAMTAGWVDQVLGINGDDAMRLSRELAQREGIFTGISGGATLAGALEIAKHAPEGANLLVMLPDTGERYLSTPLFDGVATDMDTEELEISRSTPSARFDMPSVPPPVAIAASAAKPTAPAWPEPSPEIRDFVEKIVADTEQPVVLFALEWCEFCWSLRKLFAAAGISYRAVDLDSTTYQREDRGGQIRAVLRDKTGSITIPQVFLDGQFVGGCTETMEAYAQGQLLKYQTAPETIANPMQFLPGWLQKR